MILKKNRLTALLMSFIAILAFISKELIAETFPSKPITIVVPTSPGGANDAMARIIAQGLSQKLGQSVIVENRAGANGSIASEFVARAPADGYVLMFGYIATHAINPALQKLRYDPIKSFEPISLRLSFSKISPYVVLNLWSISSNLSLSSIPSSTLNSVFK